MGFDSIIALDLGKFKSIICFLETPTRRHRFDTIDTTPQALHDLLVANASDEPSRTLVVLEACDAAGWVHDLAAALGFAVAVANCCHEAWKWKKVKRKTDKDDALKLAKMALLGERRDEADRPDHAARAQPAARDAGGSGVAGVASQRLGEVVRGADQPRDEAAEEDRDRGAGPQAAGDPVGDAAQERAVASHGAAESSRARDLSDRPRGTSIRSGPGERKTSAKCQG
jgi:hypothetical protein